MIESVDVESEGVTRREMMNELDEVESELTEAREVDYSELSGRTIVVACGRLAYLSSKLTVLEDMLGFDDVGLSTTKMLERVYQSGDVELCRETVVMYAGAE